MSETKQTRPVIVVTGGTSGIGLAIVEDLARDRDVIALGRDRESLRRLERVEHVTPYAIDLLDHQALAVLVESLPRIDGLVHSAAIAQCFTTAQASADDWRRHFELNLFAPAELSRLALAKLRAARGQIVFINSGAGVRSVPGHTVYSATKFALRALADGLRIDEAEHFVRVATVAPGPTDTPMNRKSRQAHGEPLAIDRYRYSDPKSVAAGVRLVLDATEDSQVTEVAVRPRLI
ncbi:SDR family oxidoreductase [Pseudomonas sp. LRF_L74]|uniref:SDR family oxidoreductase n=1 Tax=Pseudomonas sp. LRF_L74 TaxID=3369422 RepID=UPI003F5F578B